MKIKSSGFKLLNSALSALTTSSYGKQEKLVAQICILSSEPEQVHRLFNGNRIRTIRNAKTSDYVSKYLTALANDLTANWTLEETVYLNGKNLREMSPGMRAEALLKLFLNDRIIESENLLIILDQPEDNLDTDTISKFLIPRLKRLKTINPTNCHQPFCPNYYQRRCQKHHPVQSEWRRNRVLRRNNQRQGDKRRCL